MTLKRYSVAAAATCAATTSALAHPGAHSQADATAAHLFSSVFHMGPVIVALLVAFCLYRQIKKRSDTA